MSPQQYCEEKVAQSGSNLVSAFRILPPDRRAAITALYAFCREVDDVVDECSEPQLAAIKLAWWKTELDRLFSGQPTHPVSKALAPALSTYALDREAFDQIVEGVQMDLQQNRYARWDDLNQYCDRVAGAVGLLSARIFGRISPATLEYAIHLGRALQYTNIIRDVGDDARKGRIYIPAESLMAFGVDAGSVLRFEQSPALQAALLDMAQRAHQAYDTALAVLPKDERVAQRPGLIMAAIYRDLLRLLESENFAVMHQRISVAPARKVWLAWRTAAGFMPA
jgi:15-cis-phytoene synthase